MLARHNIQIHVCQPGRAATDYQHADCTLYSRRRKSLYETGWLQLWTPRRAVAFERQCLDSYAR